MFKKIFSEKTKDNIESNNTLVAALLIHAARIDEDYTDVERGIIKKAMVDLYEMTLSEAEELIKKSEKKEQESNQIVEFTKEIKKYTMEFRHKIIEILWKIVYSDRTNNMYESNLIRRVCGLLYVTDKDSGEIKLRVENTK